MSAPAPGSIGFSSAQSMADFRRVSEMLETLKGSNRPASAEEISALKIIVGRFPEPMRTEIRMACAEVHARAYPGWSTLDQRAREGLRAAARREWLA